MKKGHHLHGRSRKSTPEPAEKNEDASLKKVLLITAISVLPYLPSLDGDFVFDDAEAIVNNPIVNGKESLFKVLSQDFWGRDIRSPHSHKSYRPLVTLTFWLNYKFGGTSTLGYHGINIVLHVVATLIIYHTTLKLCSLANAAKSIAHWTSLLFAVHPVHCEAVANVTGRSEILMTIFAVSTVLCFLQGETRKAWILFHILAFAAVFSKEQGIMALPICLALDFLFPKNTSSRRAYLLGYFLALTWLRLFVNGFSSAKFTRLDNAAAFIENAPLRMINYVYLWLYHAFLLIFPYQLCFDYAMGCIPVVESWKDYRLLSPLTIVLASYVSVKLRNTLEAPHQKLAGLAIAIGALSFLPSSNIFFTVGFTVAERVLYLPSFGFCLLAAIIFHRIAKSFENSEIVALTVLLLAMSKTYHRAEEWRSEFSLYSSGLEVCPANAKIHYNLAKVLGDSGNVRDAEQRYWDAIRLNPSYEQALNNLGNLLEKNGEREMAEQLLLRAVRVRPQFAAAWMNLGITQMNLQKYQNSEKSLFNSLAIRPNSADCLFNLGILYQKTEKKQQAMQAWLNSTKLNPHHSRSWTNLLVVLDELGDCEQVVEMASEALRNAPAESAIHMQVGTCLAQIGQVQQAESFIKTAIRLKPSTSLYHANLGVLYQREHRYIQAADEYRKALMLDPNCGIAQSNLLTVSELIPARNTTHF